VSHRALRWMGNGAFRGFTFWWFLAFGGMRFRGSVNGRMRVGPTFGGLCFGGFSTITGEDWCKRGEEEH
jgi:hypothetical protein